MDTKQVVARFEAERQALAIMDPPNIAKVLDAMRQTIRDQEPVRPRPKLSQTLEAAEGEGCVASRAPSSGKGGSSGGAHGVMRPASKTEEEVRASSRRLLRLKETIHLLMGDLDWIVMS